MSRSARRLSRAHRVVVAADSHEIVAACGAHGVECLADVPATMRPARDRLAEAAGLLGLGADEVVVNVQGDEPLIPPR